MPDHTPSAAPDSADPGVTGSVADPNATTGFTSDGASVGPPMASPRRYELGAEVARGGMGAVYRATDTAFAREVAVKVLLDRFAPASGTARRFHDEARITGQLQHPNIPAVHDLGTLPDGRPFLAMKLIKGDTLDELLRARPDPSAERGRFVAAFEQVCQALAYAHAHNVIHRDLKPANVMVGSFGEVQVMDWGLAKVLGARATEETGPDETAPGTEIQSLRGSESAVTQAGSVLGTPAFMPPEQAVGAINKVDARSDVFGLGAILAVILTGKPPFAASSVETTRVMSAQGNVEECFARLDATGAEPELVALCKRCLSKLPGDRPADAGEVARAVAELRAAADERARRAELERVRVGEQRKRRRVQLALATSVLGLLTVFGFGAAFAALWHRSESAREVAESARAEANQERTVALTARTEAETARDAEAKSKALAQQRADEIARLNYLATIDLAGRSVLVQDYQKALTLLADCEPTLRNWEWRFLERTCRPERCLLNVQRPTEVEQKQFFFGRAEFASDSRRLLGFAGIEPILRIWDTETGKLLESRPTGDRQLWEIALSQDRRRLLLMAPGSARIWNADTFEEIRHISHRGNDYPNSWLNSDGSRLVVAGPLGEVRVFDTETGKEERLYRHPATEKVWAVGFPEGKLRLVTADVKPPNDPGTATLRIRDVEVGAAPVVIAGVTVRPNSRSLKFGLFPLTIQVSPDGDQVLIAGAGTGLPQLRPTVWNARTGKLREFAALQGGAAWFTPDGTGLVCANGRSVQVANLASGTLRGSYSGHPELLRFAAVSPDGKTVVGGGGQGQPIRVWNAVGADTITVTPRAAGANQYVAFSPDATRMIAPDSDGTVREWDTRTGEALRTVSRFEKPTSRIAYSLDGRRIVATVNAAEKDHPALVRVLDAATGRTEVDVPEQGRSGGFYGFTAASDALYLKQANGQMGEWDLARRTWRRSLPGFESIIAVSPDGKALLTDEGDRRAGLRDAATGVVIAPLENFPEVANPDSVWLVAGFSLSGDRVAVGCPDLRVRVWDARTGKLVSTLRDYTKQWKIAVQFSPDGSRLVTLGLTLEMWDVETGRPVLPTGAVKYRGMTPAFSPDGRYLFLGGGFQELLVRLDTGP